MYYENSTITTKSFVTKVDHCDVLNDISRWKLQQLCRLKNCTRSARLWTHILNKLPISISTYSYNFTASVQKHLLNNLQQFVHSLKLISVQYKSGSHNTFPHRGSHIESNNICFLEFKFYFFELNADKYMHGNFKTWFHFAYCRNVPTEIIKMRNDSLIDNFIHCGFFVARTSHNVFVIWWYIAAENRRWFFGLQNKIEKKYWV